MEFCWCPKTSRLAQERYVPPTNPVKHPGLLTELVLTARCSVDRDPNFLDNISEFEWGKYRH